MLHDGRTTSTTMKTLALAPATMGLGIALAAAWAMRHAIVHGGREWLRELMRRFTAQPGFKAVSAYELSWSRNQLHQDVVTYFMKPLFDNPCSGERVLLVRYPAGEINPTHSHPTGHGMYVLQGTLVTHRGTFGPGTFVWFPPGEPMSHGAGPDDELVALFTTSRNLRTDYPARHQRA